MFCEIFLYFDLKILTRLPVLAPVGQKSYIHENTFSTQVIGIQHVSTTCNSKLASARRSLTTIRGLRNLHRNFVTAYGNDDTEEIRKLGERIRTFGPSDSELEELEREINPEYTTFLRETLEGVYRVETLNDARRNI